MVVSYTAIGTREGGRSALLLRGIRRGAPVGSGTSVHAVRKDHTSSLGRAASVDHAAGSLLGAVVHVGGLRTGRDSCPRLSLSLGRLLLRLWLLGGVARPLGGSIAKSWGGASCCGLLLLVRHRRSLPRCLCRAVRRSFGRLSIRAAELREEAFQVAWTLWRVARGCGGGSGWA